MGRFEPEESHALRTFSGYACFSWVITAWQDKPRIPMQTARKINRNAGEPPVQSTDRWPVQLRLTSRDLSQPRNKASNTKGR